MKVALCFFGQPRFYANDEIRAFLKDLRMENGIEVDVYMHLWEPSDPNNFARSSWSNIDESLAKIDVENLREKIEDIYETFDLEIEKERNLLREHGYTRAPSPNSPEFVHRMYYSQWKVGEMLKKSGKSYDLVMRMRTDSAVMGLPSLDKLVGDLIWVPDNCPVYGWYNDNFSISSQENFLSMVEVYNNLDRFYHEGVDMNGEPMLRAQVRFKGIEDKIRRNRNINVALLRGENPTRLQGVWINGEFRQHVQLEKKEN